MMAWISENFPIIASVAVGFLAFLSALINFSRERNAEAKNMKILKAYAEIYSLLPNEVASKNDIEILISHLIRKQLDKSTRKADPSSIILLIIIAVGGGILVYYLATWAIQQGSGFLYVLFWILFWVTLFFIAALFIAGWASLYKTDDKSKK